MIYSEVNDISFVVYLFYLKDVSAEEPVISQLTISKRWLNWSEKKLVWDGCPKQTNTS